MLAVLAVIQFALYLMMIFLMLRLVLDWVQTFARSWRPRGAVLVVASSVYSVTDPPMRWLRRLIPPVNLGGVSLDMGFLVLVIGIALLRGVVGSLMTQALLG